MAIEFETKREKWDYIQENMPEFAELIKQVNELFGKPESVEVERAE